MNTTTQSIPHICLNLANICLCLKTQALLGWAPTADTYIRRETGRLGQGIRLEWFVALFRKGWAFFTIATVLWDGHFWTYSASYYMWE